MADQEIYQVTLLDGTVHGLQDKTARDKISQIGKSNYTEEEKTKLAGIDDGAQVNVIESVSVNGTALTPTDKNVNIDLSPYAKSADFTVISNKEVDALIESAFADTTEETPETTPSS